MGDGMQMQCMNHPHTNNNNNSGGGGGICALCLQDKLRNLVSSPSPSSFPSPPLSSSSSSSPPPSFTPPTSSSLQTHHTRSRLPTFLVPNKNIIINNNNNNNKSSNINIILKRSKSTAAPRKRNGFWSFLYPSYSSNKNNKCPQEKKSDHVINITEEEDKYCFTSSSPNKVSRSRSVGCGSRSFSLADCTLRRVESQRQPKVTASSSSSSVTHCMKERVRCGGIFGAFLITSSSSSSTTSSSSLDDARGKAWAWAFASPMRPFTNKPSSSSSSSNKRDASHNKNATPNLSAIPSLLTVRA